MDNSVRLNTLLILILVLLNSGPLFSSDKNKEKYYTVKKVVDGDTFWADDGSQKGIKVRLIGVDAPETRRTATREASSFGRISSGYLAKLIAGKKVRLTYDVGRYDRYGRTLAYVWLEDGTFVNADLVRNGYANVMTVPPNVRYADTFLKLERKARNQKRGMWGEKYH